MTVGIYHVFESTYNCWGKLDAKTCMSSRLYPLTVDFEFIFPAYFYYVITGFLVVHIITIFLHNLLPYIILYRTNKTPDFVLSGAFFYPNLSNTVLFLAVVHMLLYNVFCRLRKLHALLQKLRAPNHL